MADHPPGTVLGERFEVLGVIGRGGMATVYLAQDRLRDQRVALKVLHDHLAQRPSVQARLRREVEAAARVRHPAALVASDLHDLDGVFAISMPFHPGRSLAEALATDGAQTPAQVLAMARRLASALGAAHSQGVLHRDLSPGNIMLDERGAMLTDFGLARLDDGTATAATGALGTAGYAAPEVYEGVRSDPRSDLYSLGVVLREALLGHHPFAASTPMGMLQRQLSGDVSPLPPGTPPTLARALDALVQVAPDDRPQGAQDLLAMLDGQAPSPPTTRVSHPPRPTATPPTPPSRGGWSVVVKPRHRGRHRSRRDHRAHELLDAVARELGPQADTIRPATARSRHPFTLVRGVDRPTALRLTAEAQRIGYRSWTVQGTPRGSRPSLGPIIGVLWIVFAVLAANHVDVDAILPLFVVATIALSVLRTRLKTALPVAWDLRQLAARPSSAQPHANAPKITTPPQTATPPSIAARTRSRLSALRGALNVGQAELPAAAREDLRHTLDRLEQAAQELSEDIVRLQQARPQGDDTPQDIAWLEQRSARLRTLERAGEAVDPAERDSLATALARHHDSLEAAARIESRLTVSKARLLEIGSTADQLRHTLLAQHAPAASAEDLMARLRDQTQAAVEAVQESRDLQRNWRQKRTSRE